MSDLSRSREDIWKVIEDETGVKIDREFRTQYIDVWREWFKGDRTNFHAYTEAVMGTNKTFRRKSMGSAGKTCKAWAELLTREFPAIAIDDEDLANRVEAIMQKENFQEQFVKYIELAFGVGTTAVVEYIVDDEVFIDFLDVDDLVPLAWKNGVTKELATVNLFTKDNIYYVHIQYNKVVGKDYVITNTLYASTEENSLGQKVDPGLLGIEDMMFADVEPFFQVIKPNLTNKFDIDSSLGVSVFNECIDTLKAIDSKYTEFDNEFCLGKKRIVVSSDALNKKLDPDTGQWTSFLGSDTVYQAVNRSGEEPLFEAVDFQLREQAYINALNQEYSFLADAVGMDSGTFLYNGVSMKTATEVISEKSKTFGTKQKHDKMLQTVLHDATVAIINCLGVIDDTRYETEVTVTMSDSVLIDSEAKKADERIDVQSELMPKTTYLMRNYGLSEEEAKEWVAEAAAQSGGVSAETIEEMFMPGE